MNRTKEKDVIHICKGWYDEDKHNSTIDALRAYQVEICETDPKYVTPESILIFSLYPVAEMYFTSRYWIWMFKDNVRRDIKRADMTRRPIDLNYEYVCDLFISAIQGLQVKNDDGWIIDMDGYRELKHVI